VKRNWWRKTGTQTQLEEEDNIINKWAQEDVNRLYSLLNATTTTTTTTVNNNNNNNNNNIH
jgi:hypothetical protein